jgi:ADP-ribose pyrophosphatase YjhB (NUDIX family)
MNENEDIKECAKREVKEETGIDLDISIFNKFYVVKSKALYYYVELDENEIQVQTQIKDNDANGVGWFNVDCLENLIQKKQIILNLHTKILLRKYLKLNLEI